MPTLSYGQLKGVWLDAAKGTRYDTKAWATLMAAIAKAESGGNPDATNPTDNNGTQTSWGLWQISTGTHSQPSPRWNDPVVNAKLAIGKLNGQGLQAWGTYDSGAYKQYMPGASSANPVLKGIQYGAEAFAGGNASVGKSPLESIGGALGDISSVVGKTATAIDWLLLPSNWVRIFAGALGGGLVLAGTWQLSHVGGDVPRAAALPLGMVLVGLGATGLFVAFHNLPDNIDSFPALLGYLSEKAHGQAVSTG